VPSGVVGELKQSLGLALQAGRKLPGLTSTATNAFVDGMHAGVLVGAGVAFVGAIVAFVWLPARAPEPSAAEPEVEVDLREASAGDGEVVAVR
jgi:DHA2 family integral membrane protein (MFS transporter)